MTIQKIDPASELRKQLDKLKIPVFENNVPYMYLDSEGFATTIDRERPVARYHLQ